MYRNTKRLIRKAKGCDLNFFNFYHNPNEGQIWFNLTEKKGCKVNDMTYFDIDHVRFHTDTSTFTIYIIEYTSYKTGRTREVCDIGSRTPFTNTHTKVNCRKVPRYYSTSKIKKFITIPYIELRQTGCCVELKYDENVVKKAVSVVYEKCYTVAWSQITLFNKKEKNILTAHFYYLRRGPKEIFCSEKIKL